MKKVSIRLILSKAFLVALMLVVVSFVFIKTTLPKKVCADEKDIVRSCVLEQTVSDEIDVFETFNVPLSIDLQNYIFELCKERGIDPAVVIAIIEKESSFDSEAIGDGGNSFGLMQIQPKWHSERMAGLGCMDLLDPYQNVTVGVDYLSELLMYGGSIEWALMAYNGGYSYADDLFSKGTVSNYAKDVLGYSNELNVG